ncbi:MAG: zinc ABC transporter substrate-binding protein [Arenicellales bacterium]|nr:zinc ABC transporter substrate-binding protein [Arenicellales bacterium]
MLRRLSETIIATLLTVSATSVSAVVPRVVADIAPNYSLVARVMDGVGVPSLIIQHGASPHGYVLRPSAAAALEKANLVFWTAEELTPWLKVRLETLAGKAHIIKLMEVDGAVRLRFRQGVTFDSHYHRQSYDEHDEHEDYVDPHGWLDPENGKIWLDVIASELSKIDPANAGIYARNAVVGKAEISEVTARIERTLASARGVSFIVFHDAYQYFEKRFGISASGSISLGDASAPSPARVAKIRARIAELDISCVFSEPQHSPGLVTSVIGGADVRRRTIDSLGAELEFGIAFYTKLLDSIAKEIAACGKD